MKASEGSLWQVAESHSLARPPSQHSSRSQHASMVKQYRASTQEHCRADLTNRGGCSRARRDDVIMCSR
eukprot:587700-Rhodomonas_salina.3